jgi:branched-chain amino acid transport system ATP-binding protein
MLEITDFSVAFGKAKILNRITLRVGKGEVVTLIGPNGSGKTTLLKAISGLIPGYSGSLTYLGENIMGMDCEHIVKRGLCHIPEGRKVFYNMTVLENLQLGGYLRRGLEREKTLIEVFQLFPRLEERKAQNAGTLSGGEQSMLVIGRALMSKPKLLVMDEPCLGLAPISIKKLSESMPKLQENGLTILLVEQNAKFALRTSQRGYVISNGRIVASGNSDELLQKEDEVKKAYLGAYQGNSNGKGGCNSGQGNQA